MTNTPQLSNSPIEGSSALALSPSPVRTSMIGKRRGIFDLTIDELERIKNLAKMFASAKTLKIINTGDSGNKMLDEAEYFLIILQGLALGIDPMVSPNFFNVIYGRVTINTQGMMALIHQSGLLEDMKVTLVSGEYAEVTMKRKGIPEPYTARFSMTDANRMGLTGKPGSAWTKQPDTMLVNRAESKNARVLWADIINGLYTTEEMQDSYDPAPVAQLPAAASSASSPLTPPPLSIVPKHTAEPIPDDYEPPFPPTMPDNSPTGESSALPVIAHWALDKANQEALLAFLKEHGYASKEAGAALMAKLHPNKPITRWSETPFTFEQLKAEILKLVPAPAPAVNAWSDEDRAAFIGSIWELYNRPVQDFLDVLGKESLDAFPTVDAAATAFLGVVKAQKWAVVASQVKYTSGKYMEWQSPIRVRQYGRSTTFKTLVGSEFYAANNVDAFKEGTTYTMTPALLIHWEEKTTDKGAVYYQAVSYEQLAAEEDSLPWDEENPAETSTW